MYTTNLSTWLQKTLSKNLWTASTSMIKTESTNIRVLIVDKQNFVHHMLKTYLADDPAIQVVGTANSNQVALSLIESKKPDVVILDIEMSESDGLAFAQIITERFTNIKVLFLSTHEDHEYINRALKIGVKGYLHSSSPPSEIIDTIHHIHKGYLQLGPGLLEQLLPNSTLQAFAPNIVSRINAHDTHQLESNLNEPDIEPHKPKSMDVPSEQQISMVLSRINHLEKAILRLWISLVLVVTLGIVYILVKA